MVDDLTEKELEIIGIAIQKINDVFNDHSYMLNIRVTILANLMLQYASVMSKEGINRFFKETCDACHRLHDETQKEKEQE